MDEERKDYHYQFVVQDVSQEDARLLMDVIESWVVKFGGTVGGGWWLETHEEDADREVLHGTG